ncbi:MAG: hypothetical protein CV087_01935 [Candidatus Brocadia sp. WS118]|nr:MAG: hypothetical protein CV087_01935 [Candidatus Brocadia sp. WS118]
MPCGEKGSWRRRCSGVARTATCITHNCNDSALLLLYAYPKSEQDDLTSEQLKQLRKVIEKEYT